MRVTPAGAVATNGNYGTPALSYTWHDDGSPPGTIPYTKLLLIQRWAARKARLGRKERLAADLILYLMWRQSTKARSRKWYVIVSRAYVAKAVGCSDTQVTRCLRKLRQAKIISTRQLRREYPRPPSPNLITPGPQLFGWLTH